MHGWVIEQDQSKTTSTGARLKREVEGAQEGFCDEARKQPGCDGELGALRRSKMGESSSVRDHGVDCVVLVVFRKLWPLEIFRVPWRKL